MDSGGVDLPLVKWQFPLLSYRRMRARTPGTMRNLASTMQDAGSEKAGRGHDLN